MASSLFLLASLSILACSWSCHADLVADVCARVGQIQPHTISPATCARVLRTDPRTPGADLVTLSKIAIQYAKVAVKHTATVAKEVGDGHNNTGTGSLCAKECRKAIHEINTIARILNGSSQTNKTEIPFMVSAAITEVEMCDDTFALNVAGEPRKMKVASAMARGFIYVIRVIADME